MPLTRIQTDAIKDAITSSNILDGTIVAADLASNAITAPKIASGAVEGYMASSGSTFAYRNRLINGDMRIDQRNAGNNITLTNQGYGIDRWTTWFSQASKYTAQQNQGAVTPPPGFSHYHGITSSSAFGVGASDYFGFGQKIEGYNISDFKWGTANAQAITVSFWVRSSLTGSFGVVLRNGDGSYYYATTYTIVSSNTWEYKTITIPGCTAGTWSSTNTTGIFLLFGLGTGANQTASTNNTWVNGGVLGASGVTSLVGTNAATWYITGVQLEEGSVATPFENRDFGSELNLCLRYYEKTFSYSTVPGNGTSLTTMKEFQTAAILFAGHRSFQVADSYPPSGFRWRVRKRAAPTIGVFGNSDGYPAYRNSTTASITWLTSANVWSIDGYDIGVTVPNEWTGVAWVQVFTHLTASAEL